MTFDRRSTREFKGTIGFVSNDHNENLSHMNLPVIDLQIGHRRRL
jgi:hypothetical protein